MELWININTKDVVHLEERFVLQNDDLIWITIEGIIYLRTQTRVAVMKKSMKKSNMVKLVHE